VLHAVDGSHIAIGSRGAKPTQFTGYPPDSKGRWHSISPARRRVNLDTWITIGTCCHRRQRACSPPLVVYAEDGHPPWEGHKEPQGCFSGKYRCAFVLGVMAASIRFSSRFKVSGRMSTNTGFAPKRTKAFAVETKVKDGRITSSPGPRLQSIAAISRAAVHDGVRSTLGIPNRSSSKWQHCCVPVRSEVARGDRLSNVIQFLTGNEGLIEWNTRWHACHLPGQKPLLSQPAIEPALPLVLG
jgi:hypothetical protein